MAAIWKGQLTFGPVSVPVELRTAVREHRIGFRLLAAEDQTPIKFERVRADNGEIVPWKQIIKGYEVTKGHYVTLTEEDFDSAALEQNRMIDIVDFVEESEIDPRMFDRSYFIVPTKGGERAYALVREAMAKGGTVGIGKIILHKSQHLVEVRVQDDALMLMILRFAHELVSPSEYTFPPAAVVRPKDVGLAVQLIENLRAPFDPSQYSDEYSDNLRRIIKAKSKGKMAKLSAEPTEEPEGKVLDLMERLRQSLAEGGTSRKGKAPASTRRGRRPTTTRKTRT